MKKLTFVTLLIVIGLHLSAEFPTGKSVLEKIDKNMFSETQKYKSKMIVYGRRAKREIVSNSWTRGKDDSFSEYLSPPREKGTKMLKLKNKLWIFEPKSDRIVTISGNMLRQSVMGSDLSYEDFMEETKLKEVYEASVFGDTTYLKSDCWMLKLKAKDKTIAYPTRLLYVDKNKFLPLYEERYGKSGKLLKKVEIRKIMRVQNRWYPQIMYFKDVLKNGKGTEFVIEKISFNPKIPKRYFSKAALR